MTFQTCTFESQSKFNIDFQFLAKWAAHGRKGKISIIVFSWTNVFLKIHCNLCPRKLDNMYKSEKKFVNFMKINLYQI